MRPFPIHRFFIFEGSQTTEKRNIRNIRNAAIPNRPFLSFSKAPRPQRQGTIYIRKEDNKLNVLSDA